MYQSVSATTLNGLDLLSLSKLYIVTSRVCFWYFNNAVYPLPLFHYCILSFYDVELGYNPDDFVPPFGCQ